MNKTIKISAMLSVRKMRHFSPTDLARTQGFHNTVGEAVEKQASLSLLMSTPKGIARVRGNLAATATMRCVYP